MGTSNERLVSSSAKERVIAYIDAALAVIEDDTDLYNELADQDQDTTKVRPSQQ
jgi:hypothetical protein